MADDDVHGGLPGVEADGHVRGIGLGLGFTSAPATESIMGAIAARTAGVGSAVNDTTRLVGGTLGLTVIGSARWRGNPATEVPATW